MPNGRWYGYQTTFFETPDSQDQEYEVTTITGDDADELYLSELYTEICPIRYFIRLGEVGAYLHEVTDLRFTQGYAQVSTTNPVTKVGITAMLMSPKAYAYGCRIQPSVPEGLEQGYDQQPARLLSLQAEKGPTPKRG